MNDHYVPQFILRNFQPQKFGRVWYAERGWDRSQHRPTSKIFCEREGDLLLQRPLAIRKEGTKAVLYEKPQYTDVARRELTKRESNWARAIRKLIAETLGMKSKGLLTVKGLRIAKASDGHEAWARQGKDYCIRQMYRSREAGSELWEGYFESEKSALQDWIQDELGERLEPDLELLREWQKHNRRKLRTGAEPDAEGIWNDTDNAFTLAIWTVKESARFVIGSRGGVWTGGKEMGLWICPVHPKLALGIEGRRLSEEATGLGDRIRGEHFVKIYELPREELGVNDVNVQTWKQCSAIAGMRRGDVEKLLTSDPQSSGDGSAQGC